MDPGEQESNRTGNNVEEGESSKRKRESDFENGGENYQENGFSTDLELAPPVCSARRTMTRDNGSPASIGISDSQHPVLSMSSSQHLVPSAPPYSPQSSSRSQCPTALLQSTAPMAYSLGNGSSGSLGFPPEVFQRSHSDLSNPVPSPAYSEVSSYSLRYQQNLLQSEYYNSQRSLYPGRIPSLMLSTESREYYPSMTSPPARSTALNSQYRVPEVTGPLSLSPSHMINNPAFAEQVTNVQEAAPPANGGYNGSRSLTARRASNGTQVVTNASSRARRTSNGGEQGEKITAPFKWATTSRAKVYSKDFLLSQGIQTISGFVQCRRCDEKYEIEYDLREKFEEVRSFVVKNKDGMNDRAPNCWMSPPHLACRRCNQANCVKPVIPEERDLINWLFLLLGQTLGFCTLDQLKYFCKYSNNHRTGAKDRVLYLTYLGLCKQLDPEGPFDYHC